MSLSYAVYRLVRDSVRLFYPTPEIVGAENLPEGGCVIVGNHAQTNGPIVAEIFLPGDRAIWCNGEMMHLKEVPDYAFNDFWSRKPASVRWFFRLLSYVIAPISVCVFNNAHCIGVYHDARVMTTMRETLKRLGQGTRIVIFPEHDPPYNHMLYSFHDRFIDLGRMYAHQCGQPLAFVPMYVAPALKRTFLGQPIYYDPQADPAHERSRLSAALTQAITDLAAAQPPHRVVPFRKVEGEPYPMNREGSDAR